jgi:hypothetical protein
VSHVKAKYVSRFTSLHNLTLCESDRHKFSDIRDEDFYPEPK